MILQHHVPSPKNFGKNIPPPLIFNPCAFGHYSLNAKCFKSLQMHVHLIYLRDRQVFWTFRHLDIRLTFNSFKFKSHQ